MSSLTLIISWFNAILIIALMLMIKSQLFLAPSLQEVIFQFQINLIDHLCRTVNLPRTSQTLPSMSTLLVTSGLHTMTTAVVVGISPSMAPSAALLAPLKVLSTCKPARTTIITVIAILKVTVITSTRERCKWDSGLEVATLATRMLTLRQAGRQCPGSSLKRFQKLSSKHVTRDQVRDQLDFLDL